MTAFARPATASIPLDAQRWRSLDHQIVDDPCEAVAQRVRVSSRGRPWNGLAVWLQDGPVEDLYIPAMRKHCIVIRRKAACGGQIMVRLREPCPGEFRDLLIHTTASPH